MKVIINSYVFIVVGMCCKKLKDSSLNNVSIELSRVENRHLSSVRTAYIYYTE